MGMHFFAFFVRVDPFHSMAWNFVTKY